MAVDLSDEGRSVGMLRGIFDQDQGLSMPSTEDLLARAEIALAELVRWLRRGEDKLHARQGQAIWDAAFLEGYAEGRSAASRGMAQAPTRPSRLLPARQGYVCGWCREAVAAEVSGFGLDEQAVTEAFGDAEILDKLARELGADIPGHRCEACDGLGTCACGCAIWREQRRRA